MVLTLFLGGSSNLLSNTDRRSETIPNIKLETEDQADRKGKVLLHIVFTLFLLDINNPPVEVEISRFYDLSTSQSIKSCWGESIKNEQNVHVQFLAVSSSIFNNLIQMFPNTAPDLIKSTLSKIGNEDLLPFYEHLMSRSPKSFQISAIPNKKLAKLTDSEIKSLNLIRLNLVKKDVCKSLKEIYYNLLNRVQYSNYMRLNPNYPDPADQQNYKDVYKAIPGQSHFDKRQANAFYNQEKINTTALLDQEKFSDNGFVVTSPILATRLFKGFTQTDSTMEINEPYYISAAQYGCCFVGVGEVETRTIDTNNEVSVEKCPGYTQQALSKLYKPTKEGNFRFTQDVNVRGFLNSSKDKANPSIKIAVKFDIYNNPETALSSKGYQTDYKSCKTPQFSEIDRKVKKNNFTSSFNLDNSLSYNKHDASYFLDEFLMKGPKSITADAILFWQSLSPTDDISIYFDWKAMEGSAENLSVLALIYYINSQVNSGLKKTINDSLEALKTGAQSGLRKALLAIFPSGQVHGVDIATYANKKP